MYLQDSCPFFSFFFLLRNNLGHKAGNNRLKLTEISVPSFVRLTKITILQNARNKDNIIAKITIVLDND